ncbi:hypothetical protein LCGC14_2173360, partial [marine sediment metagenome]
MSRKSARDSEDMEAAYRELAIPYRVKAGHVEASNAPIDWPETIIFFVGGV